MGNYQGKKEMNEIERRIKWIWSEVDGTPFINEIEETNQMSDTKVPKDEIKELEEKLKKMKMEKRFKQLQEEGHSDVPMTITYDPNHFRLENIKGSWVLVEICEEVDSEKETILDKDIIASLKKEKK